MNYPVVVRFTFVFLAFLVLPVSGYSQSDSTIVTATLSGYAHKAPRHRSVMSSRNTNGKLRLNPLFYLATGAMFLYQRVLSEQISADCQYEISCSEYTKKQIERHGLIYGSLIGIHQLHHCTGLTANEVPSHRLNRSGKIMNPIE